ncbi:MAG: hypothetical protein H7Z16_01755 [Pyrinomonadaceae bacterium]|nr:hypothetical protein [Pyrinomonadaceae bacterium]
MDETAFMQYNLQYQPKSQNQRATHPHNHMFALRNRNTAMFGLPPSDGLYCDTARLKDGTPNWV